MGRVFLIFPPEKEFNPVADAESIGNRTNENAPLFQGGLNPLEKRVEKKQMLQDLAGDDDVEGPRSDRPFAI